MQVFRQRLCATSPATALPLSPIERTIEACRSKGCQLVSEAARDVDLAQRHRLMQDGRAAVLRELVAPTPLAATAPHHLHGLPPSSHPPHVAHVCMHAQVHLPARSTTPHTPMHSTPTTPLRSRHQQRCQRTVPAAGDPLMGDIIAKPHEALGFALPLWTQLAGLVVANILGFQVRCPPLVPWCCIAVGSRYRHMVPFIWHPT